MKACLYKLMHKFDAYLTSHGLSVDHPYRIYILLSKIRCNLSGFLLSGSEYAIPIVTIIISGYNTVIIL